MYIYVTFTCIYKTFAESIPVHGEDDDRGRDWDANHGVRWRHPILKSPLRLYFSMIFKIYLDGKFLNLVVSHLVQCFDGLIIIWLESIPLFQKVEFCAGFQMESIISLVWIKWYFTHLRLKFDHRRHRRPWPSDKRGNIILVFNQNFWLISFHLVVSLKAFTW